MADFPDRLFEREDDLCGRFGPGAVTGARALADRGTVAFRGVNPDHLELDVEPTQP